jgi:hypothetical protein
MRRFALGSPTDRKIVLIELTGTRMNVVRIMPDGSTKRTERQLQSDAEARAVSTQFANELIARGYVEQNGGGTPPPNQQVRTTRPASRPAPAARKVQEVDSSHLFDLDEASTQSAEPVMPRLAARPGPESAAMVAEAKPKKASGKKKKKKKAGNPDALDKRVIALFGVVGAVLLGGLAFIVWDQFIKPPSIVGTWRGSMTDYEIGHMIIHTKYDLILDEKHRASLTMQEKFTSVGTYSLKGNRLKLSLKGQSEDGELDDTPAETEYKISLGSATLDLMDPQTGKLAVQLIRFREEPAIGKKPEKAAKQVVSANLAADLEKFDQAEDLKLASVEFSPKDGAFKVRHPQGWQTDTGSRPDNLYSWASFTHDSAKVEVRADVKGSLLSGSDAASGAQFEPGSEFAPVHRAHSLYAKNASDDFSDFKESKPEVLKGSALGEGRISQFTAKETGLFGSKLWGYHATLLTRDRCVTVLCQCHGDEFANLKPTFLAVCRSLAR